MLLQIGQWRIDPTTNELERGDEVVRVEPKVMQVLTVLAGRAGQVVSREELLAAVWPGVVVGDEALTQTIIKLRRALGDHPRSPSYIETISKRGYRLIAPTGSAPAPRRRHWLAPVAVTVMLLAAAGFYYRHTSGPSVPDPAEVFEKALTVTVVPFETVGSGAEQGYLARGIGSDLMTDLSRLSGVRLISPTGDPAKRARYLVSGSVQRETGSLRINVRLIDASTGAQLWSHRYERPFGDLFAIQSEISRSLTEQLPGRISEAERARLAKRYTTSLEAYDCFLRAQALFLVRRGEENTQARALYAKAVELDPKFARAYAGLAMTYAMEQRYEVSAGSRDAWRRALELAEAARQIDDELPDVHWALGFVQVQARRHREAIRSLERAIELNRSYADAYAFIGGIYTYTGQPAKSIPLLRTALRLNPDGGYLYYLLLGRAYLFENDAEQALINLREAVARNPDDLEARVFLAAALVARDERQAAEWEADQILMRHEGFSMRAWLETYPMTSTRQQEKLAHLVARVGL
ncbi:MAG TPA: winged helix-turn-helix domain-containing protein [Burkholderiales bacterium]|nr:winged helix-turn-helix domain-containing protein [Burkholderiales bacterium]